MVVPEHVPMFRNRKRPSTASKIVRKHQIKLEDYGITFEKYKAELEHGISHGYKPHFGFPTLKFTDLKDGLRALNYEDEHGSPDPIMSLVNQDSIEKFQNLLLSS